MYVCAEDFEITNLIHEVASLVAPLVRRNANRLEILLPPNIAALHADQAKVRQTLCNLFSNACKFTEKGSIRLEASRGVEAGQDWVFFRVIDSGIGMTPEQNGRLFQAFASGSFDE